MAGGSPLSTGTLPTPERSELERLLRAQVLLFSFQGRIGRATFWWTSLALLSPSVLPLLGSEFSAEKLALCQRLLWLLLPTLGIKGVSALWSSILNSHERFATAAVAPAAIPVAVLAFVVVWGNEGRIYAMALGTVAGYLGELLVLGVALRRRSFPLLPRRRAIDGHMRRALGQYVPILFGAVIVSGAILVDQTMAASLGVGSVASLHYGQKVNMLLIGVAATAIGTAVMPYFSRMVAQDDWPGLRRTLGTYVRLILVTSVPATAVLYLSAPTIIRLLYQRGAFVASDTELVAGVTAMYVLQIPTYLIGIVLARFLSSVRRNGVLMAAAFVALPLNVVLNLLLMRSMGLVGIALSTSIVYLVTILITGSFALRICRRPQGPDPRGAHER